MRITIEVDIKIIRGSRITKGGMFTLRYNQNVTEFAYDWIRQIKRELGNRDMIIERVLVNGDQNITEAINEIENKKIPNWDFPW